MIATNVGGSHEHVQDVHNGFLIAQGDYSRMEEKFTELMGFLDFLREMDVFRVEYAKEHSGANSYGKAI